MVYKHRYFLLTIIIHETITLINRANDIERTITNIMSNVSFFTLIVCVRFIIEKFYV